MAEDFSRALRFNAERRDSARGYGARAEHNGELVGAVRLTDGGDRWVSALLPPPAVRGARLAWPSP